MSKKLKIIIAILCVCFTIFYIMTLVSIVRHNDANSEIYEITVYTIDDEIYIYNSLESEVVFTYTISGDFINIKSGNHILTVFPKEQVKNMESIIIGKRKDLKIPSEEY